MKGQSDEGDRRILLGDKTGGRAVTWTTTFQCVGVQLSTELPYTKFIHMQDSSYLRQPPQKKVSVKGKCIYPNLRQPPKNKSLLKILYY